MPTLFISYKRGTSAVAPLMERLRQAHYRLWFDRDEIHLGDTDWQARIDQGIQRCDGLILNLTPAACASEPVQYEVKKAQELGKPIFPIVLEKIADWGTALIQVGLTPSQHTEDFTDVTKWDEQIKRLLRDLEKQGLRVTSHDRRQQRDRNNPKYVLHQTYLKRLAERIGILNLAQINPENARGVELERVYVDSPTGLSISVEVQNWQVLDWWISEDTKQDDKKLDEPRRKPAELGYETAPFEALIGSIDSAIAQYRQENPDKKPDEEYSWRNSWNNGIKKNRINIHLNHLAAAQDRLLILGAPGSGKSTFVKYLALCLAGTGIDDWTRDVNITTLECWSHGALTPIYVELRRFVASKHFPADVKTPATADHLWAYICADVLGDDLSAYADDLRYDLEHGHAVLILDGLDEVPYPEGKLKDRQNQLISLASSLNTRYATSRVIVASRPYAYEGWTLPGFEAVEITEFIDEHRIELANRLYQVAGLDEESAHEKAQALNRQLGQIDPELKDRPLFVTLMATIYLKGEQEGLPTRRGALYRESILLLLDRWTASKAGMSSLVELLGDKSLDDLYDRLAALAYDVHNTYGDQPGTPEIDESLLYKHLKPLGRTTAAELIPYLSENAGVLVSPGQDDEKDVFHFAHRTFQEYLAGAHMVSLCVEADSFQLVRDHIMEKPQVWRVPCTLAGDVLADTDRRGDLWDFLDDLLDDDVESNIPADDPRWWTVWLASMVLQEQKLLDGEKLKRRDQFVADQLRDWTLALIETPFALGDAERMVCGDALGLLNDPRPGVGVKPSPLAPLPEGEGKRGRGLRGEGLMALPDMLWLRVKGTDGKKVEFIGDEGKFGEFEVPDFYVSKYLVTYAQYQVFAESDYDNPQWWDGFPEKYRPQKLSGARTKIANAPRDTISWYQSVAFGRWLDAQLREADLLPDDNMQIRLPMEWEWQWLAQNGEENCDYPWGDWQEGYANTSEAGMNRTTAVGMYPHGKAECGALDMAGNLWGWGANNYGSNTSSKVLRGGSFAINQDSARSSYRYDYFPFSDDDSYGCRLVVAPIAPL